MSVIDIDYLEEHEAEDPVSAARVASARTARELDAFQKDIDIRRLVLQIVNKNRKIPIEDALISGEVMRTIKGASQISLTVHDLSRELLDSEMLTDEEGELAAIDIKLDGLWFRLVKLQKQGDDVVMTFEDRDIAILRRRKGPRLIGNRARITRAQAVLALIRSIKFHKIPVEIHELRKKQPIRKASKDDREQIRDRKRSKGFDQGTVLDGKEGPLNKTQLDNASRAIAVADDLNAPDLATLAMICACIVEAPDFNNPTGGDGSSVGILQLTDDHYGGSVEKRRDIERVIGQFMSGPAFTGGADGAIALARKHPDWTPGKIAQTIQGSKYPGRYDQYRQQAQAILNEWGGTAGSAPVFKPYLFKVEKKESYWDAIQRLAKEVEWRAFFVSGTFHYISETDLFKSRARFRIREGDDGVTNIDFDQDYRKKSATAQISCRINRWRCPPGTIVKIVGLGSANGNYLVETITRNLFSAEATIEVKKPTKERKEPRPDVRNQGPGATPVESQVINIDNGAKGIVDQVVNIAIANGGSKVYVGSSLRKGSTTTSGSVSDHSENNARKAARDIGVYGFNLLTGPPQPELDRAVLAIGMAFDRDYGDSPKDAKKFFQNLANQANSTDTFEWRGFRIQIIWRTTKYGGHMGHIHVGARWVGSGPAPQTKRPDF